MVELQKRQKKKVKLLPSKPTKERKEKTVKSAGRYTIKYDPEQLKKYVEEGKSNKDIAGIMNVSTTTVKKWLKEQNLLGLRPGGRIESSDDSFIGKNEDRHLCKTCIYRNQSRAGTISCDFICITGFPRGCKPEDCNVYKKDENTKKK